MYKVIPIGDNITMKVSEDAGSTAECRGGMCARWRRRDVGRRVCSRLGGGG